MQSYVARKPNEEAISTGLDLGGLRLGCGTGWCRTVGVGSRDWDGGGGEEKVVKLLRICVAVVTQQQRLNSQSCLTSATSFFQQPQYIAVSVSCFFLFIFSFLSCFLTSTRRDYTRDSPRHVAGIMLHRSSRSFVAVLAARGEVSSREAATFEPCSRVR